jgi:hypothetical protein
MITAESCAIERHGMDIASSNGEHIGIHLVA